MTATLSPPDPQLAWERVDPQTAVAWLARNKDNRRPKPAVIAQYARQMAEGLWRDDNPDPIIFDTRGDLINGQHRLEAVVQTGQDVTMLVYRGVHPSLRDVLDTGTRRTSSDLLQIVAKLAPARATNFAAAIRGIAAWEHFPKRGPMETPHGALSNHEVLALLPRYQPTLDRLMPLVSAMHKAGVPGGDGLWLTLLHRFDTLDAEGAEEFADLVASGANLPKGSPILALRDRLMRPPQAAGSTHRLTTARLIVYAWNAWRERRSLSKMVAVPTHTTADSGFPEPK
jgi:hypothetical protein